ncbi:hypothetical protein LTS18_011516 [Coniosporium uncinatum]|uniref:Uncharacterized protein n=1 Tax=Coniosporium uncinatum TaxID=93489 RepID=A0ACC3CYF6_9PEZI|nr:hypothetical protein LTS18_011516 [Coniosporium uncinatum]
MAALVKPFLQTLEGFDAAILGVTPDDAFGAWTFGLNEPLQTIINGCVNLSSKHDQNVLLGQSSIEKSRLPAGLIRIVVEAREKKIASILWIILKILLELASDIGCERQNPRCNDSMYGSLCRNLPGYVGSPNCRSADILHTALTFRADIEAVVRDKVWSIRSNGHRGCAEALNIAEMIKEEDSKIDEEVRQKVQELMAERSRTEDK